MHPSDTQLDPREFWNGRYGASEQVWSGNVNPTFAQIVADLTPGRALDLGSGEGGDVLYLAARGWDATGCELSDIAVARAVRRAAEAGLDRPDAGGRARFVVHDGHSWEPAATDTYDLVTANFFQSPVMLDRAAIIRKAAGCLRPGGHLVVISHASAPSWREGEHPAGNILPDDEVRNLGLRQQRWQLLRAEVIRRDISGPDGQAGTIDDCVVVARAVA